MTRAIERQSETVSCALGGELRTLRNHRGWTRRDLLTRAKLPISLQTLATYELGTRQCTVTRLWELSEALEEPMDRLVMRVMQRIGEREISGLIIDLRAAARTTAINLGPLRAWARVRLNSLPGVQDPVAQLGRAALEALAELCAIDMAELVRRLRDGRVGLIRLGR